jgi:FkbM family methyltransferase
MHTSLVENKRLQFYRVETWNNSQMGRSLRLDYDLTERSVVFDLGGFRGDWAYDIFSRYGCSIHIFEPVPDFFHMIKARFKGNKKIVIRKYGLGSEDKREALSLAGDSSSLLEKGGPSVQVQIRRASEYIRNNRMSKIDLVKINIEGSEYDLLEHLIACNEVQKIENIQVQFHWFVRGSDERTRKIRTALSKTHYLTYQYDYVWENWARKRRPSTVRGLLNYEVILERELEICYSELRDSRNKNTELLFAQEKLLFAQEKMKHEIREMEKALDEQRDIVKDLKNHLAYRISSKIERLLGLNRRSKKANRA